MSLLNRQAVKRTVLEKYKSKKYHPMNRVGADVYNYLEIKLLKSIDHLISLQTSKGKTIKAPPPGF